MLLIDAGITKNKHYDVLGSKWMKEVYVHF